MRLVATIFPLSNLNSETKKQEMKTDELNWKFLNKFLAAPLKYHKIRPYNAQHKENNEMKHNDTRIIIGLIATLSTKYF